MGIEPVNAFSVTFYYILMRKKMLQLILPPRLKVYGGLGLKTKPTITPAIPLLWKDCNRKQRPGRTLQTRPPVLH